MAFNVTELPLQTDEADDCAEVDGNVFTVITTLLVFVADAASVTETVYVVVIAGVTIGFDVATGGLPELAAHEYV